GLLPPGTLPREPLLFSELPEDFSARFARAAHALRAGDELRPQTAMLVPLVVHGRLIGAWSFFRSGREPPYEPRELDLAREIAQRLALALDNARLYQTAREAVRARDEVLSTVAHDLRNPLSAISVSVHALKTRIPPEAKREHRALEAVSRGVERVTQLVSDLLDERTIESGRLSIEFQTCSAEVLVRHAAEANRVRLEGASLPLELELEPNLPRVLADANRIAQVFDNLIGNAIKFTPRGRAVRLGAARSGGFVHFWVADEGNGILPEDLPHIFDRYWKVHRADRRGAGLGLSICKGIVEAHGGKIWAESAPEHGSTFHFTLLATEAGG
ncbi:MAG TPA: GAF domain-containing sensor histidine kinase, partial [Polyangiaceae bacterium]|nr:GAF domain-containing sensor histidine kinase [Polyangiaceae bacterium]